MLYTDIFISAVVPREIYSSQSRDDDKKESLETVDPSYMSSYEVINKREFDDGGGGKGARSVSSINRDGRSRVNRNDA